MRRAWRASWSRSALRPLPRLQHTRVRPGLRGHGSAAVCGPAFRLRAACVAAVSLRRRSESVGGGAQIHLCHTCLRGWNNVCTYVPNSNLLNGANLGPPPAPGAWGGWT